MNVNEYSQNLLKLYKKARMYSHNELITNLFKTLMSNKPASERFTKYLIINLMHNTENNDLLLLLCIKHKLIANLK